MSPRENRDVYPPRCAELRHLHCLERADTCDNKDVNNEELRQRHLYWLTSDIWDVSLCEHKYINDREEMHLFSQVLHSVKTVARSRVRDKIYQGGVGKSYTQV